MGRRKVYVTGGNARHKKDAEESFASFLYKSRGHTAPENITGSAGKGGIKNVRKRKTVGFHKIAFY
ncbi:hypothetical protein D1841_15145 [Neglecta sp. X4]|nr:hypothetical protein [Neglectibacter sp. 59]NBJ74545.1 hypothetical protein [Neglectibacter sp. X4]NCE82213.1 hypothetical protein [Neglectibacter sp. X58]